MSLALRAKGPLLAVFASLLLGAAVAFPFSVDDAYITARYAKRLAQGLGYSFNLGPASDGVTGPLWLLPLIGAAKVGLDPVLAAKLCGLLCVLIAAGCCVLRARRRAHGLQRAWLSAALIGSSLSLIVWAIGGLETGAAALAFAGMALATTAKPAPRGTLLGVAIACAAWLRPELCFAAAACLACTLARSRAQGLRALWLGASSALLLLVFRYTMFGDWLPLSAYAKPPELGHGLQYAADAMKSVEALLALLLAVSAVRAGNGEDRTYALVLAAHVTGCVLAGGDWMPGLRLFAPMVPLSALLLASGVRALPRYRLGAVVMGSLLLFRMLTLVRELPAVRYAGENRARSVPALAAQLNAMKGAVMALDIGALGYLTNRPMLDLGGLVEPKVAYASGGHLDKKIDERWVARNRPAWIVLHSARPPQVSADGRLQRLLGYPVEQRVARMSFVRSHYRVTHVLRYADGYFYVILGATALPKRTDFPG